MHYDTAREVTDRESVALLKLGHAMLVVNSHWSAKDANALGAAVPAFSLQVEMSADRCLPKASKRNVHARAAGQCAAGDTV